jgi:hypothetical protein
MNLKVLNNLLGGIKMQTILDKVLEQIKRDVAAEDMTAIAEMLTRLPEAVLKNYLPE